jgi:prophage maintenance system killer protein
VPINVTWAAGRPDLDSKAAALLHSVARNQALIDGNKRLALTAIVAFYGLNGRRLTLANDAAYALVMASAAECGRCVSFPQPREAAPTAAATPA